MKPKNSLEIIKEFLTREEISLDITYYLKKYLVWQPIISNVFLLIITTVLFYLLIDLDFFIFNTATIFLEAVYNVVCGLVLYLILKRVYGEISDDELKALFEIVKNQYEY